MKKTLTARGDMLGVIAALAAISLLVIGCGREQDQDDERPADRDRQEEQSEYEYRRDQQPAALEGTTGAEQGETIGQPGAAAEPTTGEMNGAEGEQAGDADDQQEAQQVDVVLTDFEIEMPETLPPGPTTFNVRNDGEVPHNIEIEGQGIEEALKRNIEAGQTQRLTIDLKPGTYKVYCPVADHEERGMTMELTVAETD